MYHRIPRDGPVWCVACGWAAYPQVDMLGPLYKSVYVAGTKSDRRKTKSRAHQTSEHKSRGMTPRDRPVWRAARGWAVRRSRPLLAVFLLSEVPMHPQVDIQGPLYKSVYDAEKNSGVQISQRTSTGIMPRDRPVWRAARGWTARRSHPLLYFTGTSQVNRTITRYPVVKLVHICVVKCVVDLSTPICTKSTTGYLVTDWCGTRLAAGQRGVPVHF